MTKLELVARISKLLSSGWQLKFQLRKQSEIDENLLPKFPAFDENYRIEDSITYTY